MTARTLHDHEQTDHTGSNAEIASTTAAPTTPHEVWIEALRADEAMYTLVIDGLSPESPVSGQYRLVRAATRAEIRRLERELSAARMRPAPVDLGAVLAAQCEVLRIQEATHAAVIEGLDPASDRHSQHVIARAATRKAIRHAERALADRAKHGVRGTRTLSGCMRRLPCLRASRRTRHVARVAARATAGPSDDGDGGDGPPRRRDPSAIGGAS